MTSQQIKEAAKRLGADIVGIGSIDRWATAPSQMDPKAIMPRAKSIIALGFRVFRGSLRGIKEGAYFMLKIRPRAFFSGGSLGEKGSRLE